MLRLALVGAALLFSACGGPDCGFEDGTYTVTYTELNGDCPPMETKLLKPNAYPPECKSTFEYNEQCGVNAVRECMLDGDYGRYTLTLEPTENGYTGLYQRIDPVCTGLFAVKYVTQ